MESIVGARMKTAIPEERGRLASRPYEGINLAPCSRFVTESRGGALMERGWMMNMKIMIFPVKYDKFTMFFDKFLKNNVQINDCNQKGYHINLSVLHSDLAAKKVFWFPRICPQLPAFPPAPHHAHKPSFINRL